MNLLRLAKREDESRVLAGEPDHPERAQRAQCGFRRFKQLVSARSVLSPAPGQIDVVLGFGPRSLQLRLQVRAVRNHEQSVRRKNRQDGRPFRLAISHVDLPIDRQYQSQLRVASGALREQVEMTELRDIIAPELEANGLRHSEAVDVKDSAAHAELSDVLHHGYALKAYRLEVGRQVFRPASVALSQLNPGRSQRARKLGALENGAAGGDQNPEITLTYPLQSLDSLAGDLGVGLRFAEAFAWRVERNDVGLYERRHVRQPPLGARNVVVHDDEEPLGGVVGQGREHDGVAGSVQATDLAPNARRGHPIEKLSELSQRFDEGEQLRERHGAR